jgi:hypothetical protein
MAHDIHPIKAWIADWGDMWIALELQGTYDIELDTSTCLGDTLYSGLHIELGQIEQGQWSEGRMQDMYPRIREMSDEEVDKLRRDVQAAVLVLSSPI